MGRLDRFPLKPRWEVALFARHDSVINTALCLLCPHFRACYQRQEQRKKEGNSFVSILPSDDPSLVALLILMSWSKRVGDKKMLSVIENGSYIFADSEIV